MGKGRREKGKGKREKGEGKKEKGLNIVLNFEFFVNILGVLCVKIFFLGSYTEFHGENTELHRDFIPEGLNYGNKAKHKRSLSR
ncbi:MAG: hypothetical protein V1779_05830 [bacterium]